MSSNDPLTEDQRIEQLEVSFPAMSGWAFANAFHQALQAGRSVVVSEDGVLYEMFPDGRRTLIKTIDPPSPMQPGRKFTIP